MKKLLPLISLVPLLASCNSTTITNTPISTSSNASTPQQVVSYSWVAATGTTNQTTQKKIYTNSDLGFSLELPEAWTNFTHKKETFTDGTNHYTISLPTSDKNYDTPVFNKQHEFLSFYAMTDEAIKKWNDECRKNNTPCGIQSENIVATLSDGKKLIVVLMTIQDAPADELIYLAPMGVTADDLQNGTKTKKVVEYIKQHTTLLK